MIYPNIQEEIALKIEETTGFSNWRDWRWQLKHSIRSMDQFEYLTGIQFDDEEKKMLKKTFGRFPLAITPYYLSLIDKSNYKNDPIFRRLEVRKSLLEGTQSLRIRWLKKMTVLWKE